jgi:hypothetical protein
LAFRAPGRHCRDNQASDLVARSRGEAAHDRPAAPAPVRINATVSVWQLGRRGP